MMRRSPLAWLLAVGMVALWPAAARAVIERPLPLKSVIADADHIAIGRIASIDAAAPLVVIQFAEDLKGSLKPREMKLALRGGAEGKPADMLERVKEGQPIVLFVTELGDRQQALAYTEGSWFQVLGEGEGAALAWHFTHGEPYLRRTYKDSTASLQQVIADAIAGKAEPPVYNKDEKPGLGPVISPVAAGPAAAAAPAAGKSTATNTVSGESLSPYVWLGLAGAAVAVGAVVVVMRKGKAAP